MQQNFIVLFSFSLLVTLLNANLFRYESLEMYLTLYIECWARTIGREKNDWPIRKQEREKERETKMCLIISGSFLSIDQSNWRNERQDRLIRLSISDTIFSIEIWSTCLIPTWGTIHTNEPSYFLLIFESIFRGVEPFLSSFVFIQIKKKMEQSLNVSTSWR